MKIMFRMAATLLCAALLALLPACAPKVSSLPETFNADAVNE